LATDDPARVLFAVHQLRARVAAGHEEGGSGAGDATGAWVLKSMIGSRTAPARKPTAKVIGSISRSAPKELTELATHRRHQQRLNRGDQRLGQAPGLRLCRAGPSTRRTVDSERSTDTTSASPCRDRAGHRLG
jgi:hypothetical protein